MNIDFSKGNGLVPAVVQHVRTKRVLMLGYLNEEAYQQTTQSGRVTFYSRSKDRLWTKGETSGNYLHLVDMYLDCDQDTLLILAEPQGPVCHTGNLDCFDQPATSAGFIHQLEHIIESRSIADPAHSYTASLFQKGIQKIAQKVGEEAVETILEAQSGPDHLLLNEAADLVFHLVVLLKARGLSLHDLEDVLKQRHENPR
jgi:phosphoribosyl-ATP pyrophosphohydrolase/phosphoribosyl-AMP cyclohydrolase